MGFFSRNKGSGSVARDRLMTVLLHDRVKLTPENIQNLKNDLYEVIRRYLPSIDPESIDVSITSANNKDQLETRIPIERSSRR